MTASTLPPLSVWPCGPPGRVGKHKGARTAIGPSQSPSRSLETARHVGRASALDLCPGAKVSGSPTDLLTSWATPAEPVPSMPPGMSTYSWDGPRERRDPLPPYCGKGGPLASFQGGGGPRGGPRSSIESTERERERESLRFSMYSSLYGSCPRSR